MMNNSSLEQRTTEMRALREEILQLYGMTEKQLSKYKEVKAYKTHFRLLQTMGKVKGYILFRDRDLEGWRKNFFSSETWGDYKQLKDFTKSDTSTMYQYFGTDCTQQLDLIMIQLLNELLEKVYLEGWNKTREVTKIKDKGTIHARQEIVKETYKVYSIEELTDNEIYKWFFRAKRRFHYWLTREYTDTINYHISVDSTIATDEWRGDKDLRILDRLEDWRARLAFEDIDTIQALESLVPHLTESQYDYLKAWLKEGKPPYRSSKMYNSIRDKMRRFEVVLSNRLYKAGV